MRGRANAPLPSSHPSITEAIRAAMTTLSAPRGPLHYSPTAMSLFGTTAAVGYVPDEAELARRDSVGLPPITDPAVLDLLMALPAWHPVNTADLTDRERKILQRVPAAAVEHRPGSVIRHAVPPLTVQFVLVAADTCTDGLVKAGRFAPFARRGVLLPALPDDVDDAIIRAKFYGIGLWVSAGGTLDMLLASKPYVRVRHSPMHWCFAEQVLARITQPAA